MNTLLRTALLSPALLLTLVLMPPAPAFAAPNASDNAYAAGTRAMNQQRWNDAVADFDKVVNAHASRADAALYWKAYSLNKLGNGQLAFDTCVKLQTQFPDSRWNKDCKALSIDMRVHVNGPDVHINPDDFKFDFNPNIDVRPRVRVRIDSRSDDPNEEIKMLALNSLLRQDPARALPILRNILSDSKSTPNMKRRAIFILAQNKSPEAAAILHDAVTGKMDPSLQRDAIQSMAVFEGKRGNDTLAEVYRNTSDAEIKRAVINAFFISHDAPRLVELARSEKDIEVKRDIVSRLALMHDKVATDYMLELLK
ncbi:HEAT repeat domain-containing protein [Edaphobacter sp.]|uniref:HEAT repeat domain-containing protein n=1 Tax=Edaphobacter sp. TaxID=1934404 RepID=UPI002DBCB79A|nr:HEAT repeat domain-containing protein [Edaphobacter sp.]HEU5340913.1 HEAT repeat domain-containing protein [Edaphobacter sp.]